MSDPICLKTGYRGKKRPSCIYVHRPDLTGKSEYTCPTCSAVWYKIPGAKEVQGHPDQNWTRNKGVLTMRDDQSLAWSETHQELQVIKKA